MKSRAGERWTVRIFRYSALILIINQVAYLLFYSGEKKWLYVLKNLGKLVEQAKKKKQKIKERFIQYFQINEDPFYPYSKSDGYHTKCRILPQEHLQEDLQ